MLRSTYEYNVEPSAASTIQSIRKNKRTSKVETYISAVQIQMGYPTAKERDEEINPTVGHAESAKHRSGERNSSPLPTPGSTFERTPSPSKGTTLEYAPGLRSQKYRTTSRSSDKLNEVLPQSSTTSQSVVDKAYPSGDKEDAGTNYKNDANLPFRKVDESQQTASTTFNKNLTNERSRSTPRSQVEISSVTETSLRNTHTENHSSKTSEVYSYWDTSTKNGDSVDVNFEAESKQNRQKLTGSFRDFQEGFLDKKSNLEYSIYSEVNEDKRQTDHQKTVSQIDQDIKEELQSEKEKDTKNESEERKYRPSRKDQLSVAMDWQHKLQLRVETLSWKYKSLEVEYKFLEKLIAEQREDLSKAKVWAKHAAETRRVNDQEGVTYDKTR